MEYPNTFGGYIDALFSGQTDGPTNASLIHTIDGAYVCEVSTADDIIRGEGMTPAEAYAEFLNNLP